MTVLLDDVDVDTDGEWTDYPGGLSTLIVRADTWGGGTVKVEYRDRDGNGISLGSDFEFTADNAPTNLLLGNCKIRATLTGSTSPSNVSAELSGRV